MIVAAKAATGGGGAVLPYRWVAVGYASSLSSAIYTSDSTTAASWTSRTTSFSTTYIWGVASDRYSRYVAVGAAGKLATSPDAITWTQQTSSFSTSDIFGVAFGEGIWVAVGANNKIATSSDGVTWTQRTTGGTTETWVAVAYGNGTWAILASNGAIRTADDPTGTWTARTSTLTRGLSNGIYYDPTDAIWVAGAESGTTGALASSTDAVTWTSRDATFASASTLAYMGFASNSSVIIRGGNTTTAGTSDIESSTNGTSWTNRTPADTAGGIQAASSDDTGLLLVMGTSDMNVQTSPDGTTWTNRGTIASNAFYAVCHSSGLPAIR